MTKDSGIKIQRILSEEEDREVDTASYKIKTYGADLTLEVLSKKIDEKEIIVPPFQRKYVWPEKKASKLIESFLLGLPIPQIFLYREEKTQNLLVVDGQQRLKTINFFFKESFDDGKVFQLRGVKENWEGKRYSELNEQDKRRFKNSILRAAIFEQTDPKDNTSVIEIFERLNTGGMALTEQEIRNCVISGKINLFLEDLNKYENWRSLLGKKRPDTRMRDIEIILRFLALYFGWETYKKPMKDFISNFMRENKNLDKELRAEHEKIFKKTVDTILHKIGTDAFRLKTGINVAVADSLMVGIAKSTKELKKGVKIKYSEILANKKYIESVSEHTTDSDSLQNRIKIVSQTFAK